MDLIKATPKKPKMTKFWGNTGSPILSLMKTEFLGKTGSAILTLLFVWDIFRWYAPMELRQYLLKYILSIKMPNFMNPCMTISIDQYLGGYLTHETYIFVKAYLRVVSSDDARHLKAEMSFQTRKKLILITDQEKCITDKFNGVRVEWTKDKGCYKLTFHKRYEKMIKGAYLEHVVKTGREIQQRNRPRRLYSNNYGKSNWSYTSFEHPASFETLAMEQVKKDEIIDDLMAFTKSKDYYARIGKAWRRGYLLYGPPGTGKSTMIAAMANLLVYDVYDLDLSSVKDNAELRKLLTETKAKSIIVIEDIDCSHNITGQRNKKPAEAKTGKDEKQTSNKEVILKDEEASGSNVTLSGLLNFIDGLWSSSAGERLIVFTTNYKSKLDPALTRRGRMDKHIHLSYCKYEGFKVLAQNYLGIEEHPLFESVEELINKVSISPADVAENLMPKSAKEGSEQCLQNLIQALKKAKETAAQEKAKEKQIVKSPQDKDSDINKDAS